MDRLRVFRFSLRSLAILFLGIAIGLAVSRVPSRISSNVAPSVAHSSRDYLVEPPDVLQITVSSGHAAPPVLAGQFMVAPDGNVELGVFGKVMAARRSVLDVRDSIAAAVRLSHPHAAVTVDVANYNSKNYYMIKKGNGADQVLRLPFTGVDRVRDALSRLGPDVDLSRQNIWIARPGSPSRTPEIIEIDLGAVAAGASAADNHQMLPGDRLIVSEEPMAGFRP